MNTYKVVGDKNVLGYEPGETFQADLPVAQEERLIARGAIEADPSNTSIEEPSVDRSPPEDDQTSPGDGEDNDDDNAGYAGERNGL